jgi:hypothetical protein
MAAARAQQFNFEELCYTPPKATDKAQGSLLHTHASRTRVHPLQLLEYNCISARQR